MENEEQTLRYKIIGDVYEIKPDGTLVHIPNQKVLSRMSYKHESYVIVQPSKPAVSEKTFNLAIAFSLLSVTAILAVWWLLSGRLV